MKTTTLLTLALLLSAAPAAAGDRDDLLSELTKPLEAVATAPEAVAAPIEALKPPVASAPAPAPVEPKAAPPAPVASAPLLKHGAKKKTPLESLKDRDVAAAGPSLGYIAVGVMLLLLAGVAVWLRRRAARTPGLAVAPTIETLCTTRVAGKHAVSLIRVGGRILVVGVSEKSLTLLTELDDGEIEAAKPQGTRADKSQNLMDRLSQLRAGWTKEPGAKDPFRMALAEDDDDAPVDEVRRESERSAIRERLDALRRRAVA